MKTPVSYQGIDAQGLHEVLDRYAHVHHAELVGDFENQIAKKAQVPYVVATNSGTAALHLALQVMGVQAGDRVIVPTFSYVAVVNPVLYLGALPVFVDCDRQTWNLDLALTERALHKCSEQGFPVKAIVAVHNYGTPEDMPELMTLAKKWKVWVVEDAAESLGATIEGKWTGTWGDVGTYSFNSNKTVSALGGGAVVTERKEWADEARFLASQARQPKPYYEFERVGYNYLISPLNAAYGLLQFGKLEQLNERRRALFHRYRTCLSGKVEAQAGKENNYSTHWLSVFLFKDRLDLERMMAYLEKRNFEVRRLWNPLHKQRHLSSFPAYLNGLAEDFFERGLCLPSGFTEAREADELIENSGVTLGPKGAST